MNRRARGFTLLEVLLAAGAAAVIAAALYSAMYTGFRARTTAQLQGSDLRSGNIVLDMIENDLQSIQPIGKEGSLAGPFIGTSAGSGNNENDTIDLYCIGSDPINDNVFGQGFRHVMLGLTSDSGKTVLTRRITRNLLNTSGEEQYEDEILAEDVLGLSVQYYDGTTWTESWDSTQLENALPTMISITIRLPHADATALNPTFTMTRLIKLSCGGASATTTTETATGGGA